MKVLSVSLSCTPKIFLGLDVLIVFLESHELHVNFSRDVSGCS